MSKLTPLIPALAVVAAMLILASPFMRPADSGAYDMETFGRLPVSAGGRTKPFDSVARNSLMIVSDRQTATIDGKRIPAIHWLLDVMARPVQAGSYEVFRVDHPDVKNLIGSASDKKKHFSFDQIFRHAEPLSQQAAQAQRTDPKHRTAYQRHLGELIEHVNHYIDLRDWHAPYVVPPLAEGEQWRPLIEEIHNPHEGHEARGEPSPPAAALAEVIIAYQNQDPAGFNQKVTHYAQMLDQQLPDITRKARFEVFFNRLQPFYQGTVLYVLAFLLGAGSLLLAGSTKSALGSALGRAAMVLVALTFCLHTFGLAARIYMQGYAPVTNLYSSAVFIGWFCVGMGLCMEWLYKNGLGVALATVIGFVTLIIAHNLADGDTMQMMQAVLDSNFWLSTHVIAVTIGYSATFMAGLIGLLFIFMGVHSQCVSRNRITVLVTMLVAAVIALLSIAIAIALAVGDIMEQTQAFLGLEVWSMLRGMLLMIGYTSSFFTVFIGSVLLVSLCPWRPETPDLNKTLGKMIYGTVAFALLFSFVGTVLGGIWADQSWGRFWGWDPKENGAVLIVLMNALILHARWGGMVKTRGVAVLAVFGNIVTAWSWFGTNMLGVGLHSYGFMDSALFWMLVFVSSQLAIMTAGLIPQSRWKSFAP